MTTRAWALTIGATTGAAATGLVVVVMVVIGVVAGESLSALKELIGFAFFDGPPWLGPLLAAAIIVAGGAPGAWAAAGGEYGYVQRALVGVLALISAYLGWTTLWTMSRLGPELSTAPFAPFYLALLTLVGLLLPLVLLFVPAAVLWARIVERLLVPPIPPGARSSQPR